MLSQLRLSQLRNNHKVFKLLILTLIITFGVLSLCPVEIEAGRVRVRGYYRKDGTYVKPHYRTVPDGNPYNNYSYPGNYNPNTGKITPGDPQKYLNRYYNRSKTNTSTANFDKWLKSLENQSQSGNTNNVQGFYRKDRTYVKPHYRTVPDGNPYNNYSYPGNYNPNTGKITPGDPQKYLNRYYNRSKTNTATVDFDKWLKSLGNQLVSPNTPKVTSRGLLKPSRTIEPKLVISLPSQNVSSGFFTVGSKMSEVVAIQGTPNSFSDTRFDYGFSTVYFHNGRVTRWSNSQLNPLRAKLKATLTNKTYFTVGSTKGEVVAIQGTPDSFSDTRFDYGFSTVYFHNGRVTRWSNSQLNPLRAKLKATPTNKTYFTVGSTKGEVVAIQGTPDSFSETRFDYGFSTVYFHNGRVTRWSNSQLNPLRAKLKATPTNKTYFTVGSTKGEVVAIQGTPDSFSETRFDYGFSTVYFHNGRVTSWSNSQLNPLRAKLKATPTNKTYFTVGSTKGEVVAIQGTPDSFSETRFDYGFSTVYFHNGRVTSWSNSQLNPLKVR